MSVLAGESPVLPGGVRNGAERLGGTRPATRDGLASRRPYVREHGVRIHPPGK